jgi:nucleoside-diphosphate-sugar epimerase
MHFLITGGAGFIGSHLTESLIGDGHSVYSHQTSESGAHGATDHS